MVSSLDKKLGRDLWRIKGQATAIAVVIALGVLMLVMMDGLVNSLEATRTAYYERYRLADIFAPVKRAPDHVIKEIAEIDGVNVAEGRIFGGALIDLDDEPAPIRAQVASLPDYHEARLNDIYLTQGRALDPTRKDEIILLKAFADARDLGPGDQLSATMNGARRTFDIVGLAQSPEFLYAVAPGEIVPDDRSFAVFWMSREALGAAFDLDGAFNEALVQIGRNGDILSVIDQVDRLLEPYGGVGAYGLEDQLSNRFVSEEISGLRISARTVPSVFLFVAAFLLYIVISRIVQSEREQIGLLKAFGYSGAEVSLHYFKFTLVIAVAGAALGCIFGVLSGRGMVELYLIYYKFPFLVFSVDPTAFAVGLAVSIFSATIGGILVLRQVFALTPAVAMRPPAPADFSKSIAFSDAFKRFLDQPSRMVLRRFIRQPWRAAVATIGIGAGMALSISMLTVLASFDEIVDINFSVINRGDVTVSFIEPLADKTLFELKRIPGVSEVEPFRSVPAILRHGRQKHRGGLSGLIVEPRLNRAMATDRSQIMMRGDGIILAKALSDKLGIEPGDMLTVEVRNGRRPVLELPVASIAETLIGAPAYIELGALNRAMKEPYRVSGAYLRIDSSKRDSIYKAIKNMPAVAGVSRKEAEREALVKVMNEGAGGMRFVMAAIAGVITFGIVYNSARIAFAERERDLASLRVIGFTRGEASFVLLGEIAIISLLALPVGIFLGQFLAIAISAGFSTELYQIPVYYSRTSYATAALAVLAAACVSGWLVSRDVDKLSLVECLKSRE